jgi:NitT/TauT family transport system substrate-binding protein
VRIHRISVVACLITLRAFTSEAAEKKLEDVNLAVPVFSLGFALEYLNQDMGLYEKYGLNAKTLQIDGLGAINAVISGSVDFAEPSGTSFTRAAARGQRLLAIVEMMDHPSAEIILRKDIAAAAGFDPTAPLSKRGLVLKDRTLGVSAINSVLHGFLRLVAGRAGVDPETINIGVIPAPNLVAAFTARQIDGFVNDQPWTGMALLTGDAITIASGPDGDPPDLAAFANTVVVTKPETCAKRKAVCIGVGHAFAESAAFLHNHLDEARVVLSKRFAMLDPKLLATALKVTHKLTPSPPVPTRAASENIDRYNIDAGLMKPEEKLASYDGLYTDEYVK